MSKREDTTKRRVHRATVKTSMSSNPTDVRGLSAAVDKGFRRACKRLGLTSSFNGRMQQWCDDDTY